MLSPTYEITTTLSHTDELISPRYDIAIVTISYGRVTMSSVWDSMMSKKNMGWPFYAAVNNNTSMLAMCFRKSEQACISSTWTINKIQIDTTWNSIFKLVSGGISHATFVFLPVIHGGQFLLNSWQQATLLKALQRAHYHVNAHPTTLMDVWLTGHWNIRQPKFIHWRRDIILDLGAKWHLP